MKKKHRVKFCGKCQQDTPVGSKKCVHCGWNFKRGRVQKMMDKLRRFINIAGEKKIGS